MSGLKLEQFEISKAAFEICYKDAYLLWDHAGSICSEIQTKWPNVMLRQAGGKFISTIDNRIELAIGVQTSAVIFYNPLETLKDFTDVLAYLIPLITRELGIKAYSRIGFRIFYIKPAASPEAAAKAVFSTKKIQVQEGRHFGLEGENITPEYALRWEDDTKGV
ncbi:MAG: hypothetical protein GY862_26010, partial [Gammaproteobacteria bacterium]|nr:hypothetical protein [Gammaproteobacteria bacterium]